MGLAGGVGSFSRALDDYYVCLWAGASPVLASRLSSGHLSWQLAHNQATYLPNRLQGLGSKGGRFFSEFASSLSRNFVLCTRQLTRVTVYVRSPHTCKCLQLTDQMKPIHRDTGGEAPDLCHLLVRSATDHAGMHDGSGSQASVPTQEDETGYSLALAVCSTDPVPPAAAVIGAALLVPRHDTAVLVCRPSFLYVPRGLLLL